MIKVTSLVEMYEEHGDGISATRGAVHIKVHSHESGQSMVVIEYVDGESFAVYGEDLKLAIDNAMNKR
jgi:hypothetical protein